MCSYQKGIFRPFPPHVESYLVFLYIMTSYPWQIPRRTSSPATSSTLYASPSSSDHGVNAACVEGEDEDLLLQSSQSSRIVSVPQNDAYEQTRLVISNIELIFESMVDVLAGGGDALSIPYRSRDTPQQPLGSLKFPGRTVNEATKFSKSALRVTLPCEGPSLTLISSPPAARMVRVMELCRDALISGRIITKRCVFALSHFSYGDYRA